MNINTAPPVVLLADKDAKVCSTLESFFRQVGWNYEIVGSASSGLAALEKRPFDIVIAEFELPDMGGSEFIRALKTNNPDQALVVLTSDCSAERAIECLRQGVVDLIQKPIDLVSLEETIKKTFNSMQCGEQEQHYFNHLLSEFSSYVFQTSEIAGRKIPLMLAEKLYKAGKIALSLKLKLQLVFDEALTNSLDHGNLELESYWREEIDKSGIDRYAVIKKERLADSKYADRKIYLEVSYCGSEIRISIRDEGKGFKPPPAKLTHFTQLSESAGEIYCHGRGLSIMHSVMDEVFYSDDGRQLTLVKCLGG